MFPFGKSSHRPQRNANKHRVRLCLEALESRLTPYSVSGNNWVHPDLITISFVPDGTVLGSDSNGPITSNLFASLNSHPGWTTATWQKQILKAAQVWAQQTNVNFAVVSDNGADSGSGSYQQGDPGFGDIRIGGFDFNDNYLAVADLPPQTNSYSIAGDITFNTGQPFNIGSTYDLFSVAAHEFGHSLGLNESNVSQAVMFPTYSSPKSGLSSDDVSGIRSIDSNNHARTPDRFNTSASNGRFATASNITSSINATSLTAVVNNLDLTTISQVEYYTFTAPAQTTGTLTVQAQSSGLSLLAPTLTVYAADQTTVLGFASGAGQYGTTLTVTLTGVTANQQFYVKVAGTDKTAFSTGKYALTLNFGSGASPTVSPPNTQTANSSTYSAGGGQAQSAPQHNGGFLGGVLNFVGEVLGGLVGNLLGISTTSGIGAGVGDPLSPFGEEADSETLRPAAAGAGSVASTAPAGQQRTMGREMHLSGVTPLSVDRQSLSNSVIGALLWGTSPSVFTAAVTPPTTATSAVPVPAPAVVTLPSLVAFGTRSEEAALTTGLGLVERGVTVSEADGEPGSAVELEDSSSASFAYPDSGSAAQPLASSWSEACTACFARDRGTPNLIPTPAAAAPLLKLAPTAANLNPAAAVAALAVVLGSGWGTPRPESEERKCQVKKS